MVCRAGVRLADVGYHNEKYVFGADGNLPQDNPLCEQETLVQTGARRFELDAVDTLVSCLIHIGWFGSGTGQLDSGACTAFRDILCRLDVFLTMTSKHVSCTLHAEHPTLSKSLSRQM